MLNKLDSVLILLGLFVAVTIAEYFKITPNQGLLDAILLALSVKAVGGGNGPLAAA